MNTNIYLLNKEINFCTSCLKVFTLDSDFVKIDYHMKDFVE